MTTSSEVRRALEKLHIDVGANEQHIFTVHEEHENMDESPNPQSEKEIHCPRSEQGKNKETAGLESVSPPPEPVKPRSGAKWRSSKGKTLCEPDTGSRSSKSHPIQAIEASLRRWLVYLEGHEVSASYADLLLLQACAKRFMDLVDFYFLTLVDLLMKGSQVFEESGVNLQEGIAFPPPSALKLTPTERSKVDMPIFKSRYKCRSHASSSSTQSSNPPTGTSIGGSCGRRNDLHVLQDWLTDGIDYLENEPVKVFYEDFQVLHATTKKLVELLDSYFKDLVDTLLERCAIRSEPE
ncbi:hypothetical protein MPTK1_5g24100 [Marchantia polymorpha subsp. ruderalis]|uniref:Uncharacterized protein n=1 Tax=Marchantia polymorpha subsp. ruderalis TaxID=1480154 RepID=A0AAF6BLQ1_MARPO|nr:hypothetical protein Mp_5g24100 [Marchantia polymorpha subsp. ruderalis]